MKGKTVSVVYMLFSIVFCVSLIVSNLMEMKVIDCGWLTLTGGLLIFPISYIVNDCITEIWGYKNAKRIIWTGFIANFFAVALTGLATLLPSPAEWEGGEHFNYIFGLAPRMVIASMMAFLAGSFLNAKVMSKMKMSAMNHETQHWSWHFSVRAIVSTIAGESLDSVIFFPLAFWGLMPVGELVKVMLIQVILKTMYEVLVLPVTIGIVKKVNKLI